MDIKGTRLMLIGGAGLVGSHIVDRLTKEDVAEIVVFDNFVRGTRENLAEAARSPKVRIVEGSMLDRDALRRDPKAGLAALGAHPNMQLKYLAAVGLLTLKPASVADYLERAKARHGTDR